MRYEKDSHCGYCGKPFGKSQLYPKRCPDCDHITYRNPTPVAVVLLPVDDGLLAIRRGIQPGLGKLALPGGYIDWGETWQQGAARELFEETGIVIAAEEVEAFRVRSSSAGHVVIFGLAQAKRESELPAFVTSHETTERVILPRPIELAFDLHTEAARLFFEIRLAASRRVSRGERET